MTLNAKCLPLTKESNILITGSTGLIGGELLKELLLSKGRIGKTWSLVRAESDERATKRLKERLQRSGLSEDAIGSLALNGLSGDVTSINWGLSNESINQLKDNLDMIIHCASDTSFLLSDSVFEVNVKSTKCLIDLVKDWKNPPLVIYISTAANIGNVISSDVTEDMVRDPGYAHHNLYTKSKAACEKLLTEAGIPTIIMRPSIVLSAGIEDPDFANSILWMIPLIYHFEALPINGASRIDIVPVEFVTRTILKLLEKESLNHNTYHISAGRLDSTTVKAAFQEADRFYGRKEVELIRPHLWNQDLHRSHINSKRRRELYHRIKYYFPFLNMDVVYDNNRLKEELGPLQIEPLSSYMGNLLGQITESSALEESMRP